MRFAVTCNGPGEFAGWVRPLARAFAELAPDVELHCFFVPDDYATGREADVARETLPGLHVHTPKEYVNFALGAKTELEAFDGVLYLGGDILHAVRIHTRLGGKFFAYRYAPKHVAKRVHYAFALDAKNAKSLRQNIGHDRIETVGNLAVDGAIAEASGVFGQAQKKVSNGVLFMPGSRKHEIANLFPFFTTTAMHLRRLAPDLPIAFGLSPFVDLEAVDAAMQQPLEARLYARHGHILKENDEASIVVDGSPTPFPIVREALQSAVQSRLVVTIPGTKCIELAALGVPHIVCTPFNLPERVTINGLATYLDRVPVIGKPLKRAAVLTYAKMFLNQNKYYSQPNIDAGREVSPELYGTLTPGYVADQAAMYAANESWQHDVAPRLKDIYAPHIGVAHRVVQSLLRETRSA